jgi:protein CpxP
MKKLLIICALLFSVVTFASAQGQGRMGGTPEERIKRQTDQLVEKLKLTDDQKAKATEVFTAQVAAQTKMREEMQGGDRAAMMEKMQKMTADTEAKINAFLTDEQKKAYKVMIDEQKAAREKAMKERQGGGGK